MKFSGVLGLEFNKKNDELVFLFHFSQQEKKHLGLFKMKCNNLFESPKHFFFFNEHEETQRSSYNSYVQYLHYNRENDFYLIGTNQTRSVKVVKDLGDEGFKLINQFQYSIDKTTRYYFSPCGRLFFI